MLNKIEFSDLYKFLTSVGLIFIVSAFIIPWLFMREGVGILVSEIEYGALIEESKNLTDKRIELNSLVISSIPWISSILFLFGLIIVGFGLYHWKKKQNRVDETEILNLVELRSKIQKLNTSEIREKAKTEVEEEISATSDIIKENGKSKTEISSPDLEIMKKVKICKLISKKYLFY